MKKTTFWRLKTTPEIRERLSRLHPTLKKKIMGALRHILGNPNAGKRLRNDLEGLLSFRTGHFRIIYRIEKNKTISIIAVGPRKTIYEETLKLVEKEMHRISSRS